MCGASFHPSRISARCIGEDDFIFDSAVMDSEDVYTVNKHPLIVCKLAKPVTFHRHLYPFHEVKSKREKKNKESSEIEQEYVISGYRISLFTDFRLSDFFVYRFHNGSFDYELDCRLSDFFVYGFLCLQISQSDFFVYLISQLYLDGRLSLGCWELVISICFSLQVAGNL
ncbi:hypothetical protein L2E82_37110 [Cichorium intybus]|uniref:Uncharacterized protein n=1 Tax=Cichorium intybus TaxID=13427 RepID=A0ACB9AEB1_CICIN|nr:hypothetical protein L2E82_37110 [Cichorium intybus]